MNPAQMLQKCVETCYSEPESVLHTNLSRMAWERVKPLLPVPFSRVLDLGAGSGVALKMFREAECDAVGVNLHRADVDACREAGFACRPADMHELPEIHGVRQIRDGWQAPFDLVWARHILEHSPFPMLALSEIHRVLADGGLLYAEVPDPETACCHHTNLNHYSCFTRRVWEALIVRSGFEPVDSWEFTFNVSAGDDRYFGWVWRKA